MTDVCVLLKSEGKIQTARIHKTLLNAFHDPRWYQDQASMQNSPLLSVFVDGAPDPSETFDYGMLAIDRDTKWIGSCQNYMSIVEITVLGTSQDLVALKNFDLDKTLGRFDKDTWGQVLVNDHVRLSLLDRAYQAGAITRVRAAKWGCDAPWQEFKGLGLSDAPSALDWLNARRKELSEGHCVLLHAGFEFAPPGWTVHDFDSEKDEDVFAKELAQRGLTS